MQTKITLSRRQAIKTLGGTLLATPFISSAADSRSHHRMSVNLVCGMIGVRANQRQAVDLAHAHGFDSVEAMAGELARMPEQELQDLLAQMRSKNIVFGAAGLTVDFRGDDSRFSEGMQSLPRVADALKRAGVDRVGTWITPGSNTLTFLQTLKQHARRLREVAAVLDDRQIRLGLEYVGTKTLRDRYHFEFVHTMAEAKELIAEIDASNVGFVLDSWHWWNANETSADILSLQGRQVIAVDLNDAPAGIPKEKQMDGQRELPLATGVIDVGPFLNALNQIGYDGPVRAEPFNKELNDLDNEAACGKTSAALRKAFALIES